MYAAIAPPKNPAAIRAMSHPQEIPVVIMPTRNRVSAIAATERCRVGCSVVWWCTGLAGVGFVLGCECRPMVVSFCWQCLLLLILD